MSASPQRDRGGRFQRGSPSPNPNGRPRKTNSVDEAVIEALGDKVVVTERGRRLRRSKLKVTAAQIANKSAGGDLRAAKLMLDQARKAEANQAEKAAAAPAISETDEEIIARVIARLTMMIRTGQSDGPEA